MDQQLQQRLRVYEHEQVVSPEVVQFVRATLSWLEDTSHHPCTEESAGVFASHFMLALMRIQQGESIASAWHADIHEEAMKLALVLPWVEYIQQEARRVLGLTLPPEECDFLLLHLGAFLSYYDNSLLA